MARQTNKGFSLIELVIVVVIIGIIAAIAIPKMSRGSAGASDSALTGDLTVLRNAIELYNTGAYRDEIVICDGTWLFREKLVVFDTNRVDSLLVTPL